jgi:hypothetical protein
MVSGSPIYQFPNVVAYFHEMERLYQQSRHLCSKHQLNAVTNSMEMYQQELCITLM